MMTGADNLAGWENVTVSKSGVKTGRNVPATMNTYRLCSGQNSH